VSEVEQTTILFRPVGPLELALIQRSEYREFPPRLEEQPIFYPVLTREHAEQIACEWNSQSESTGHLGYVTRFAVDTAFLARYEPKQVGGALHLEYWVPATELAEFNQHIVGSIDVVAEYHRGTQIAGGGLSARPPTVVPKDKP
jgi:hypothetical protein